MKKQHLHLIICFTFLLFCIMQTACGLTPQEQRERFIEQCKSYLGTPYKYGGTNKKGMDCSGFIFTSAKESLGLDLPRRSEDLYNSLEHIEKADLQPGDLIFFKATTRINHAAVYLGDNTFIHSASDGPKTGVIISNLDESYWKQTYAGCAQLLPKLSEQELASLLKGEKKTADEKAEPEKPKAEENQVAKIEEPKNTESQIVQTAEKENVEKVPNAPVVIKQNENGGGGTKALRIEARKENEADQTAPKKEVVQNSPKVEEETIPVTFKKVESEPVAATRQEPEKTETANALPKPEPAQKTAVADNDATSSVVKEQTAQNTPANVQSEQGTEIAKVSTPVQNASAEEVSYALPVAEPVIIEKNEEPAKTQPSSATAISTEAAQKSALPLPSASAEKTAQSTVKTGTSAQVSATAGTAGSTTSYAPEQTVVSQPQLNVTISVEGFIN